MNAVQVYSTKLTDGAIRLFRGADKARPRDVALKAGDVWTAAVRGQPVEVRCLSGTLWVTRENDSVDHVLPAGTSLKSVLPGLLVATAFRPAKFRVRWNEK